MNLKFKFERHDIIGDPTSDPKYFLKRRFSSCVLPLILQQTLQKTWSDGDPPQDYHDGFEEFIDISFRSREFYTIQLWDGKALLPGDNNALRNYLARQRQIIFGLSRSDIA